VSTTAPDPGGFQPPPLFELVKELNAHAGRLLTLLGLLVTATAFSLSNGLIRDALVSGHQPQSGATNIVLILLALNLMIGFFAVAAALQPPVPMDVTSEADWTQLVTDKHDNNLDTTWAAFVGIGCLGSAWFLASPDVPSTPPILQIGLPIVFACFTVLPHLRSLKRWPWLWSRPAPGGAPPRP